MVGQHRDRFGDDQADHAAQDTPELDAGAEEDTQANAADAVQGSQGTKAAEADEGARLHAVDRAEEDQAGRHLQLQRQVRCIEHARGDHAGQEK
jgi:hypothetical protein